MGDFTAAVRSAISHMNAMELEPALAALEPVCRAALEGPAPENAVACATALYLEGLVRNRREEHDRAFAAHAQCIERFVEDSHTGARECVQRSLDGVVILEALQHEPPLLARLPAAHHALRLPTNIEMLAAIDVEMADATQVQRDETRASLLMIIRHDDARAGEQHERARTLLRAHFEAGAPFGLYLRNFDIEASEKRVDGTLITMTTSGQGYIEARAERDLAGEMPLLGLANGTNFRPDFAHAIPKLEVPSAWWQAVLEILARRASTVLFDYRHPSPGVAVELELLQALNRAADTVIVVADDETRSAVRAQWPAFIHVRLPDDPVARDRAAGSSAAPTSG